MPQYEEGSWKAKVVEVLDKIRPNLQADGGDAKLMDISDEGVVSIALQGHCRGCPHSQMTLKHGIERVLKQEIEEVTEVKSV